MKIFCSMQSVLKRKIYIDLTYHLNWTTETKNYIGSFMFKSAHAFIQ